MISDSLWELVPCSDLSLLKEAAEAFGLNPLATSGNTSSNSSEVRYASIYFNEFHTAASTNASTLNNSWVNGSMTGGGGRIGGGAGDFPTDGLGSFYDAGQLNMTFPCIDMGDLPSKDTFKMVITKLNLYFTPLIIIIGATGNLLAFLVFTVTHLRRQSSSVYLASLAVADMGFLMSLFVVWLASVRVPLFTRHVWCQAVVYMMYVCTFLSVWYVVSFTVERYIIVWYPLRKDRLCTQRRAQIVVIALAVFALVFYSFAPHTSGIVHVLKVPICMPFPQYYHLLTVMEGIDSMLTLIIPSIMVIMLNIRIFLKISGVEKQRQMFVNLNSHEPHRSGPFASDQQCRGGESGFTGGHIMHIKFSRNQPNTDRSSPVGQVGSGSCCSCSPDKPRLGDSDGGGGRQAMGDQNTDRLRCSAGSASSVGHGHCSSGGERPRWGLNGWKAICDDHSSCGGVAVASGLLKSHCSCCVMHPEASSSAKRADETTPQATCTTEVFGKCRTRVQVRSHTQYRTARVLMIVSTVFVVLNVPSHVFRINAFIRSSMAEQLGPGGHTEVRWHELFQLVYHLNFAINFFIYMFGHQFRAGLKILCSRIVHRFSKWQEAIKNSAVPNWV